MGIPISSILVQGLVKDNSSLAKISNSSIYSSFVLILFSFDFIYT